ncbi:uncharacterized protein LOC128998933 [Macrosteles quadrilineatus]|uniref:uncharacterized protein LOC128998933 n=1 Tax=Macrosteles quadrilineatus TaxID=74068 RepID=UPI0023E18113|nr:uncharacterized protein LOC128998933 [Macrosteles quadrilineatus]
MAPAKKSGQSAKEKLERQGEKARERQRKRRAKLTEDELEKKKQYDRDRYKKEKEEKKKKSVKDMSAREQRKIRKMWREQYKKKKEKNAALAQALNNTPPDSPGIDEPAEIQANESSQKKRGRKAVTKDISAAYREIKKQQKKIEDLERRLKNYKKTTRKTKIEVSNTNFISITKKKGCKPCWKDICLA